MLVTALCLTKDRREWLPGAIACFQDQNWPEKEMVIVAEGTPVEDLVPFDPRIWAVRSYAGTAGEAANLGCQHARGEFIVHFDDDDYSAPARMQDQAFRLHLTGKAVTGYHSVRYTDGERWWKRELTPQFAAPGATLCYRREWWERNPFLPLNNGVDNVFVTDAHVAGQLITADSRDLMYQRIHAGNAHRYAQQGHGWTEIECPSKQAALA